MVNFDSLVVGTSYDRPYLARLWGYEAHNAFARGVFTPKGQDIIILFITKEKQESLTQYEDRIDNDILFWEGEKGHINDVRIISGKDEIHVLYRERHHQDFVYKGKAQLENYRLYADRPSRFSFVLLDMAKAQYKEEVIDKEPAYLAGPTTRESIVNLRIGQDRFREASIRVWHNCCVSGFTKRDILIASHIKPWRVSDDVEKLDGYNSLLLVPTYDKLFDRGYIGFDAQGRITISDKIDIADVHRTGLDEKSRLLSPSDKTIAYLNYHQQYVFDLVEGKATADL